MPSGGASDQINILCIDQALAIVGFVVSPVVRESKVETFLIWKVRLSISNS
jgi:hypothetical protein